MLRRIFVIVVAWLSAVAALQADAEPRALGLGPIRLGMSIDQVRAATPNVTWDVDATRPYTLKSSKALTLAGQPFDLVYDDLGWEEFRIIATALADKPNEADCRAHIVKLLEALEAEVGELTAPAAMKPPPPDSTVEALAFGKASHGNFLRTTKMAAQGVWLFGIGATHDAAPLKVVALAQAFGASNSKVAHQCKIEIVLDLEPPRPPKGVVPREDLVIASDVPIGVKHHTLDSAPALPVQGLDVDVDCTIGTVDGRLHACQAARDSDADLQFRSIAERRAGFVRAARPTASGKWSLGEKTTVRIHLAPEDRRTVAAPSEIVSSDLPRIVERGGGVHYPPRAVDRHVEAQIDLNCIIQSDGSIICPEARSSTPEFAAEFIAEAMKAEMALRYATLLTNGKPSTGVAIHNTVNFVLH
jgi:hypothetical protein